MSLSLTVSEVWKSYGGTPVLKGASLSINEGGISVLMGDNGSGKSTLLRLCSLLEVPEKGSITYFSNDNPLPHDIGLRRRITLVLPRIGAFNTTVFNNVAYGLRIRGIDKDKMSVQVSAALFFVGLSLKAGQSALTLSSGEAQRLGIARALVIEPEVLFLDEPAAFVDAKNREIIEEIILNLKKQGRTAIVLSTHDNRQAERLADRLLVLKDGLVRPS